MISVIILNRNRKEDLLETIESIYKQTYQGFEIIVIDQASTDGSVEVVKKKYPKEKIIALNRNLGVAGGRNYGASLSKGKYLLFLDNDAIISKNALYETSHVFDNNPNIGAIAFNIINYYSEEISNWGYPNSMKKFVNKTFITTSFCGCAHAIRKDIFDKLGGFNNNYHFWGEEIEFALKLYKNTKFYIIFYPKVVARHKLSSIERFEWKNNRYFYKVKNKLDTILLHYTPFYRMLFCFTFWVMFYFIQSFKYGALKQYWNAVLKQDYHKIFRRRTKSNKNIERYFKIRRKMLVPIFPSNLFLDL